jgi:hypothetical protein
VHRATVPGQFACLCKVKLDGWRQEDGAVRRHARRVEALSAHRARRAAVPGRAGQAKGGHKAFLTREEKIILAAAGKKTEMPAIGELSYAEPDTRTIAQVVQFNRLRRWRSGSATTGAAWGKGYQLQMREAEKELRKQLVDLARRVDGRRFRRAVDQ